jgi:predicted nucleic acid-binding protein
MRLLFDTSAFLALEDEDDENHASALDFRAKLRSADNPYFMLYTTNYIIDETITIIRSNVGHSTAVSLGELIKSSSLFNILWIDPETEIVAWTIFKKYKDKDFSFTDCTSFATMEKEKIDSVFTYDKHFKQYGFSEIVP